MGSRRTTWGVPVQALGALRVDDLPLQLVRCPVPWKLLELPAGELAAPTNNINTTVVLSLLTSVAYFGGGLFKKGLGYFARYVKPTPILLPINILEDFTKPLSLSFRLFGNVLADELTVAVLTFLVPFVIPLPIMGHLRR